jgi:hypothetical protein
MPHDPERRRGCHQRSAQGNTSGGSAAGNARLTIGRGRTIITGLRLRWPETFSTVTLNRALPRL